MAAELWESERQRTARFVEQRRRDAQALHWAVLRRVNAHVAFSEHRQAQHREDAEAAGAEAGDELADQHDADLALDFLEDMDADDVKSLLVNAASAATTATVTATATVAVTPAVAAAASAVPPVSVLAPLTMPTHLLSVASGPLMEDAGVSELMEELNIDLRSFAVARGASADEEEERKTEESMPPRHVLEQRVLKTAAALPGSPKTPPVAKSKAVERAAAASAAAAYDPDAAAKEMHQWVSGERHPDVVKRRESLRGEKRKRVRRYGTNTLEEQVSVRRVAKMYAAEGDSSSSSGSSSAEDSDFSPVEVIEVDEDELLDKVTDEEPFSETELQLGDDEDEDAKRKRKAKARRRLRQQAAEKTGKKKPRTKMVKMKAKVAPAEVMKDVVVAAAASQGVSRLAARENEEEEEEEEEEEIRRPRVFAKPAPAAAANQRPQEPEAIDLRSESENESEKDVAEDLASCGDSESESELLAPQPAVEKERMSPMVLKLKVSPKDMLEITQKQMLALSATLESSKVAAKDSDVVAPVPVVEKQPSTSAGAVSTASVVSETRAVRTEDVAPSAVDDDMDEGYGTDEIIDEEPEDGESAVNTTAVAAQQEALPAEADADSDTGTVDFEQEELRVDVPDPAVDNDSSGKLPQEDPSIGIDVNERASPSTSAVNKAAPTTENELQPVSPQVKRSPPYNTRALAEEELEPPPDLNLPLAEAEGDISEAETVNFEDVDSDIDFGSGESEDFGEDGAVVNSDKNKNAAMDDDGEEEFSQFFGAPLKKKKKLATVPAKPQPVTVAKPLSQGRDASPVKPVRAKDTPTPSPEAATKAKTKSSLLAAAEARGSNGLRSVQNINTKTVSKGKYQYKRRAIQMVDHKGQVIPDPQSDSERARDPKRSLFMRGRQPVGDEGGSARYLAYHTQASRPTTKDQFSSAAKAARERFDKTPIQASKETNGISFVTSVAGIGTGVGLLKPLSDDAKRAKSGSYIPPREPQLDVYQATGAVSQIDDSYLDGYDKDGHKRPIAYQKEIAEAKRSGVDVRKGLAPELNPNAPIPKKSELQKKYERNPELYAALEPQLMPAKDTREKEMSPPKAKRAKTSSKPVVDDGRPSKYGPTHGSSYAPSGGSSKHEPRKDSSSSSSYRSNGGRGSHGHSNGRDSNSSSHGKKRQRTASPPRSRDRDRDHDRGRGRGRGGGDSYGDRDRSHKRSGSSKDSHHKHDDRSRHGSSHNGIRESHDCAEDSSRYRSSKSPTRSWSATESSGRRREEEKLPEADRRSSSYDERRRADSLPSYVMSEQLARSMSDGGSTASPKKPAIPSTGDRSTPLLRKPLGGDARSDASMDVAGAMDDGDSEIADSDDEIPMIDASFDGDGVNEAAPAVFDIRVQVDEIEIDEELCHRTVYCFNLKPLCSEENLEKLFSPYGIAEDRSTGFPAVEVFVCQRNNRARGDARITFETPENANLALNEVNGATFMDAKLGVRAMDRKTMRILKAQFDSHRDTWTCPSASCRSDVSVWTVTCPKCFCKRQFAPSHVNINPDSWLCRICYSSNHQLTDKCSGCNSSLPPYQSSHSSRSSRSRDRSRSRSRDRDIGHGRDRRSY